MIQFRVTCGRIFSLGLLLLVAARVSLISGQQVGVSLTFLEATIPSDSFVDFDDVLNIGSGSANIPSNRNPRDAALQCITDLIDCCGTESGSVSRTERGNWYFPDGTKVLDSNGDFSSRFQVNRGPNEVINGQTVYGSVRLFHRFSAVPGRGHFYCELPNNADPNTNQRLYANILNFGFRFNVDHVIISPPSTGSSTAGRTDYSLTCSSTLYEPPRLSEAIGVPSPNFQWSFDGSASLPSGVTAMSTFMSSSNSTSETYTSTLQFSFQLSQSLHTGMYTCQLGPGRLMNTVMVTVSAPPITVMVTANLNTPLMVGQTGNTLTCDVSGANNLNPMIIYRWTRTGATVPDVSSEMFNLSPLQLSQAGVYTCRATVSSDLLNQNSVVEAGNMQTVTIQVPNPESVTITASPGNTAVCGSTVTINCTVEIDSAVLDSDLPLLNVSVWISRNGTVLMQTSQSVVGTIFNFGATVNSFDESDNGDYVCTATVIPLPSSTFLTGVGQRESVPYEIRTGIPPTQLGGNTRCYSGSDIAIALVVYTLIECLLAAPIITALLVFCWKRNKRNPQYKSATSTIVQGGEVNPGPNDVYEDPDKTAATTTPGKFKLTECPAYVATTSGTLQSAHSTTEPLQTSYYELQ